MYRVSLSNILRTHKKVVLDTAVLYLSKDKSPYAEEYNQQINHFLVEDSKKPLSERQITTIPSVISEISVWFSSRNNARPSADDTRVLYFEIPQLPPRFEQAFEFLYPYSLDCGLTNLSKHYPNTDVSLAALALALTCEGGNYVLCSPDRLLNEFTYLAHNQAKNSYVSNLPFVVRGNLDIYSFFPSGDFVLFKEERKMDSFSLPSIPEGFSFLKPSPHSLSTAVAVRA